MDGSPGGERLRLRFVTHREAHLLRGRFAPDPGGFNDFGGADATRYSRLRSDSH